MKLRHLVALSITFFIPCQSFQLLFLDPNHPIYKDSTNLVLEHALTDFHYYYVNADRIHGFDFSVEPTYRYLNIIHGLSDINMGGLFMQARGHYKKFWFKANTLLGGISENHDIQDYPERNSSRAHTSFGGFDDLTVEVGYDFYQVSKWGGNFSIFLLGGIPVNGQGHPTCDRCGATTSNIFVATDNVRLGTGFYRLGAGLQASAIFYCREGGMKMLTLFTGFQWNYVFPRSWDQLLFSRANPKPIPMNVHVHPATEFSTWDALNFNYYEWGFELGVTVQAWGHFKDRFNVGYEGKNEALVKREIWSQSIQPILNSVTPYLACSYGKTFKDNPYSFGLGIAYEFDNTDHEVYSPNRTHAYKNFQGVQVWGNATYSF